MFELHILIPTTDNAGNAFAAEDHAAFEGFVIDRFGGITLYPSHAVGAWIDAGTMYRDSTRIYGIAVKSIVDGAKIAEVVAFAKAHYGQLAIFIRYLGIAEIL